MEPHDEQVEWEMTVGAEAADVEHEELRIPETPIRLTPEQQACPHEQLEWQGCKGIFRCVGPDGGCGAELVVPELEEGLGVSICND
jgi:hypothetical protein